MRLEYHNSRRANQHRAQVALPSGRSSSIVLTDPFFGNRSKRLVKWPKLHYLDTGLAAFLSGFESAESLFSSALAGAFWESHVAGEIWCHFAFARKFEG